MVASLACFLLGLMGLRAVDFEPCAFENEGCVEKGVRRGWGGALWSIESVTKKPRSEFVVFSGRG